VGGAGAPCCLLGVLAEPHELAWHETRWSDDAVLQRACPPCHSDGLGPRPGIPRRTSVRAARMPSVAAKKSELHPCCLLAMFTPANSSVISFLVGWPARPCLASACHLSAYCLRQCPAESIALWQVVRAGKRCVDCSSARQGQGHRGRGQGGGHWPCHHGRLPAHGRRISPRSTVAGDWKEVV
jgi:hypothetical protein